MMLLWVVTCLCLLQLAPAVLSLKSVCNPNAEVVAEVTDRYNVKLYEPSLELDYEISVGELTATRVQLTLNSTKVFFLGYTSLADEDSTIHAYFEAKPITAERITVHEDGERKQTCELSSARNHLASLDLLESYQNAIFDLTDHCLSTEVCEKIDRILAQELNKRKQRINLEQTVNRIALSNIDWKSEEVQEFCATQSQIYNPQGTINAMVDFVVAVIISKVPIIHGDIADLPNIDYSFKTLPGILESSGDFQATDGTLQGISSLKRIKDVVFEHYAERFTVSTSYQLSKISVSYKQYKGRFGIIKSGNGYVTVNVDGLTVSIKTAFDFNKEVCRAELVDFKLEHHGDIDVKISGLWPFNTMAQNAISNIIRTNVLATAKDKVAEVLQTVDCEQYRPR